MAEAKKRRLHDTSLRSDCCRSARQPVWHCLGGCGMPVQTFLPPSLLLYPFQHILGPTDLSFRPSRGPVPCNNSFKASVTASRAGEAAVVLGTPRDSFSAFRLVRQHQADPLRRPKSSKTIPQGRCELAEDHRLWSSKGACVSRNRGALHRGKSKSKFLFPDGFP